MEQIEKKGMNPAEKKKSYLEAEELFREWKSLIGTQGNEGRIQSCKSEIWNILDEIISSTFFENGFDKNELALGGKNIETIAEIIEKYDPDRGPLEHYANFLWDKRKNPTKKEKEDVPNQNPASLDESVGEDGTTLEGFVANPGERSRRKSRNATENNLADLIDILNNINRLYLNNPSQGNKNLRMIFTDIMTDICKNAIDDINIPAVLNRQKSIMDGIDVDFLDFYMASVCRNLKAIQDTNLKIWKEIPRSEEVVKKEALLLNELDLPLSNKVYTCFVWSRDASDASKTQGSIETTISKCRGNYTRLLKEWGLERFLKKVDSLRKVYGSGEELAKKVLTGSPLQSIAADYISQVSEQDWRNLKSVKKGLYDRIDEVMKKDCEIIQRYYESLEDEEAVLVDSYRQNIAKSYVDEFIKKWENNFAVKLSSVKKKKKAEKHVPDYIKDMAQSEIKKRIAQDEETIQMVLKSLNYEFEEKKQIRMIERLAIRNARSEIIRRILREESINRRIVYDTIRVLEQSKSSQINKIVNKVQDDNLYSYYWM